MCILFSILDILLISADLKLKSDSIDSLSLALSSQIELASENNSQIYFTTILFKYFDNSFGDNTAKLKPILGTILWDLLTTLNHDGEYKNNIKEDTLYKSDASFKRLVDLIYQQRLVICQQEGHYYVESESSKCRVEYE